MKKLVVGIALLFMAQAGAHQIRIAASPEVGRSVKRSAEMHVKQTLTFRDSTGRILRTDHDDRKSLEEWTDTTVRRTGTNGTFRYSYTKIETEANGEKGSSPLQGETVTITARGDNVGMMLSNGMPITEQSRKDIGDLVRTELHAEANNNCIPTTGLSIGASWNVPSDQARDCFAGIGVPTGPVTASGKLISVDGGYATVDFKFAAKLTSMSMLEFDPPAPVDGTVRFRVSLTNPLDWTSSRNIHLVGKAQSPAKLESMTTDLYLTGTTKSGG